MIIGKEPAIDIGSESGRLQYKTEIDNNRQDWLNNIEREIGFDNVYNEFSMQKLYGNPLHPHCWQKYQINRRIDGVLQNGNGTSRTWYQYQKLIDMIVGKTSTREDSLDFHKYCFSTDLSEYPLLSSGSKCSAETQTSIKNRLPLFTSDFVRNFPIVIVAIGGYRYTINRLGLNCTFNNTDRNEEIIIDTGISFMESNPSDLAQEPKLLIYSYQLSARISDNYLHTIANKVIAFAHQYNIELIPSM